MPKESFLLVSLEESKAKKLAQVISNDTSRKILDLLAKKESTETEISRQLGVPISTIHYNLKALVEANLVNVEEFHYSEKGKEVNHYSLANKLIIIAPKETKGLKETLRKFLPLSLLSLGGAAIIYLVEMFRQAAPPEAGILAAERVQDASLKALPVAESAQLPFALWFLFGALFVLVLLVIFEMARKK